MKPGEKGFTLVELLVAIPIMALVSFAAGEVIFQVLRNTEHNSNHMAAVLQLQNAGNRITSDIAKAQTITTANLTLPNFLVLNWIDSTSGDDYQVTYTLENLPGSTLKQLKRNQSTNGSANTTALIAQYIDSSPQKTSSELSGGVLTLTITATEGAGATKDSETRTYQIVPRPD